jgi:hypothetical protein
VELGGDLESSKNGDYTISFTEADYQP